MLLFQSLCKNSVLIIYNVLFNNKNISVKDAIP